MLAMFSLRSASGKANHWDLVHCVLECGWKGARLTHQGTCWGWGFRPKHTEEHSKDPPSQLGSLGYRSQSQVLEGLEIWLSLWFSSPHPWTFPASQFIFWMKFKLDSRILGEATSAQDAPVAWRSLLSSFFACLMTLVPNPIILLGAHKVS